MTVSTSALELARKPIEAERLLALPELPTPPEPPLLTHPETSRKECKSLNLRVGPERYEWFHAIKERLRRPTNEKTLESLLAITEFYLESRTSKRTRRLGRDCFEIEMGETKREERASRSKGDCFDLALQEERIRLAYFENPSQNAQNLYPDLTL